MNNTIQFNDKNFVIQLISYVLMAGMLALTFALHLMIALISGLLVFVLITNIYNYLIPRVKSAWAHKLTLLGVLLVTLLMFGGIASGIYYAIKVGGNVKGLETEAYNILQQVKSYLPPSLVGYIPDDLLVLKEKMLDMAKQSGPSIFEMTGHSAKAFVHSLIGMLLGAVVAFSFLKPHDENSEKKPSPFLDALKERLCIFASVFRRVIFAQAKISGINTLLTTIYLLVILPLSGVHLPYSKTLVLMTFLIGLIPVLGNLITNFLIVLISLTVSFKVAIASLVFLILVHKLEYYVNARVVGSQIKTSIWEILIAMVVMEAMFGLFGVALAPVIYGYIKAELKHKGVI